MKVSGLRVAGFVKVRNEILREGNLYRLLDQMEQLCDHGVICDDASTDGTREALRAWCSTRPEWFLLSLMDKPDFIRELRVKQDMLNWIHVFQHPNSRGWTTDWILWMDGDELFDARGLREFRPWLEQDDGGTDVWAFHYTQLWRSASWARVDHGFDAGWFWKLWRYRSDLSFDIKDRLHHAQFPAQYVAMAVTAAGRGGSWERAKRAPFEILHLGNYGKNLAWKAIQYRNSGPLEKASLERHLYFPDTATRPIDPAVYTDSVRSQLQFSEEKPVPFTPDEIKAFERMGDLKGRKGLFVVIIPTYNRGYILEKTIASVCEQTYSNWVCVVLDDGSTDNTPELMRSMQERDPRIFYCRYNENRGGVAVNEVGMNLACEFGEFWVRLGSDDYLKPHKLELDALALRAVPHIGACWGPYRDLHNNKDERELRGIPFNSSADARGALLSHGFAASWANIAVRSSVLQAVRDRHGMFCDPSIRNMEDWIANARIAYLTEFLWRARLKDGRIVVGSFRGDSFKDLIALIGPDPEVIVHDAIWRIGADGASQNAYGRQAAIDSKATMDLLTGSMRAFTPTPREEPFVRFLTETEATL